MEDRLYYEVGAYRISRNKRIDQGRDGMLWIPPSFSDGADAPAVAAVSDGVGKEGRGHAALQDFEFALEMREMEQSMRSIRAAIIDLLREKHHATFVGVQFPRYSYDVGVVYSLGDSSAFQVKRQGNKDPFFVDLTEAHTMLREMKEMFPDLEGLISRDKSGERMLKEEVDRMFEIVGPQIRNFLKHNNQRPQLKHFYDTYQGLTDVWEKQRLVFAMLNGIADIITLDLASSRRTVDLEMKHGQPLIVEPGDDVVLHTDGMDLTREEILVILETYDPVMAARLLTLRSDKLDDRAVIVARARRTPGSQFFKESFQKSLRPTPARLGTRR